MAKTQNPTLRDALKMGFAQVCGMPGVAYYKKGKHYNPALVEVDLSGNVVGGKAPEFADPDLTIKPRRGALDVDAVVYEHNGDKFTNGHLLDIAFMQSGLTAAKWNEQNDAQIAARVTELIEDMKSMAKADGHDDDADGGEGEGEGDAEGDGEQATTKTDEQTMLEGLLESMNAAKAEMDAWTAANNSNTPEGKKAYNRLNYAYAKAKKAYEKAAGLSAE